MDALPWWRMAQINHIHCKKDEWRKSELSEEKRSGLENVDGDLNPPSLVTSSVNGENGQSSSTDDSDQPVEMPEKNKSKTRSKQQQPKSTGCPQWDAIAIPSVPRWGKETSRVPAVEACDVRLAKVDEWRRHEIGPFFGPAKIKRKTSQTGGEGRRRRSRKSLPPKRGRLIRLRRGVSGCSRKWAGLFFSFRRLFFSVLFCPPIPLDWARPSSL